MLTPACSQVRVILGIYSFRLNRRISEPGMPGDMLVDVDHSGTGREGCNVSTLAVTCEPRDWRKAVEVATAHCSGGLVVTVCSSHLL